MNSIDAPSSLGEAVAAAALVLEQESPEAGITPMQVFEQRVVAEALAHSLPAVQRRLEQRGVPLGTRVEHVGAAAEISGVLAGAGSRDDPFARVVQKLFIRAGSLQAGVPLLPAAGDQAPAQVLNDSGLVVSSDAQLSTCHLLNRCTPAVAEARAVRMIETDIGTGASLACLAMFLGYTRRMMEQLETHEAQTRENRERLAAMEALRRFGVEYEKAFQELRQQTEAGPENPAVWFEEAHTAQSRRDAGEITPGEYTEVETRILRKLSDWIQHNIDYVLGISSVLDNGVRERNKTRQLSQCDGKAISFIMMAGMIFNWQIDLRLGLVVQDVDRKETEDSEYSGDHWIVIGHSDETIDGRSGADAGNCRQVYYIDPTRYQNGTPAAAGEGTEEPAAAGGVFRVLPAEQVKQTSSRHGHDLRGCRIYEMDASGVAKQVLVAAERSDGLDPQILAWQLYQHADPELRTFALKWLFPEDDPWRLLSLIMGSGNVQEQYRRQAAVRFLEVWPDFFWVHQGDHVQLACRIATLMLDLGRYDEADQLYALATKLLHAPAHPRSEDYLANQEAVEELHGEIQAAKIDLGLIARPEEQEPQQSNRHETYQRAMARIDAAVLDWFAGQDVLPEARVICLFAERVLVELYGEFVAISEIPNHLVEKIFDQAGKYLVAGIQRFGDQAPELARLRMLVPLISKREILDAYWVGHFWQTCLSAQFRQLIARKETAQQHGAIIVQLARETLDRDMSIYFINSAGGIAYEGNQFEYSFKLWQETLGLDAQNADALRYLAKGHMRYAATMMVGKRPVEARRIYEEGASWVGTYRRACSLTQGYGYAAERMIYLVQTDEWKELALADPDLGFEAVQSALQPVQHLDGQTPDIQARVGLELGKATLRYAHTVARPEQGGVCSGALRTLAEADQALIDAAGPAKDPEVQKKIWYYRVLAQSSLGEAGEAVKTAELIRKNLAGIPGERYVICYSLALQLLGNAGQLPWDEAAADPAVRMELEAQAESMLLAAQALLESVVLIDEAHLPYHVCQEYGIDSFAAQRRIGIDAKILQAKVYLELAALAERRGGNREAIQVYRHSALALVPQTLGLALERNFKITSMLEIIAQMVDVESMELLLAYHSEHDVRAMITVILGLGVEAGDEGSDVLQHKAFAQAIGGYSPDMLLPAIAVAATAARVVHPDMVHRIGVLSSEASVREGCRALAVDAALHQLHGAKTRQLLLEIMRDTANDASREDDPEVQAHLREVLQALHARRLELMYAEVDHLDDIHEEGDDTELLRVRYEVEYCLITNDYKGTVEVLVRYLQDLSGLYNFGTYRPMVRVIQDVVTNEVRTDFSSYAYVDAVCTDVDWFINLELFGQMAVIALARVCGCESRVVLAIQNDIFASVRDEQDERYTRVRDQEIALLQTQAATHLESAVRLDQIYMQRRSDEGVRYLRLHLKQKKLPDEPNADYMYVCLRLGEYEQAKQLITLWADDTAGSIRVYRSLQRLFVLLQHDINHGLAEFQASVLQNHFAAAVFAAESFPLAALAWSQEWPREWGVEPLGLEVWKEAKDDSGKAQLVVASLQEALRYTPEDVELLEKMAIMQGLQGQPVSELLQRIALTPYAHQTEREQAADLLIWQIEARDAAVFLARLWEGRYLDLAAMHALAFGRGRQESRDSSYFSMDALADALYPHLLTYDASMMRTIDGYAPLAKVLADRPVCRDASGLLAVRYHQWQVAQEAPVQWKWLDHVEAINSGSLAGLLIGEVTIEMRLLHRNEKVPDACQFDARERYGEIVDQLMGRSAPFTVSTGEAVPEQLLADMTGRLVRLPGVRRWTAELNKAGLWLQQQKCHEAAGTIMRATCRPPNDTGAQLEIWGQACLDAAQTDEEVLLEFTRFFIESLRLVMRITPRLVEIGAQLSDVLKRAGRADMARDTARQVFFYGSSSRQLVLDKHLYHRLSEIGLQIYVDEHDPAVLGTIFRLWTEVNAGNWIDNQADYTVEGHIQEFITETKDIPPLVLAHAYDQLDWRQAGFASAAEAEQALIRARLLQTLRSLDISLAGARVDGHALPAARLHTGAMQALVRDMAQQLPQPAMDFVYLTYEAGIGLRRAGTTGDEEDGADPVADICETALRDMVEQCMLAGNVRELLRMVSICRDYEFRVAPAALAILIGEIDRHPDVPRYSEIKQALALHDPEAGAGETGLRTDIERIDLYCRLGMMQQAARIIDQAVEKIRHYETLVPGAAGYTPEMGLVLDATRTHETGSVHELLSVIGSWTVRDNPYVLRTGEGGRIVPDLGKRPHALGPYAYCSDSTQEYLVRQFAVYLEALDVMLQQTEGCGHPKSAFALWFELIGTKEIVPLYRCWQDYFHRAPDMTRKRTEIEAVLAESPPSLDELESRIRFAAGLTISVDQAAVHFGTHLLSGGDDVLRRLDGERLFEFCNIEIGIEKVVENPRICGSLSELSVTLREPLMHLAIEWGLSLADRQTARCWYILAARLAGSYDRLSMQQLESEYDQTVRSKEYQRNVAVCFAGLCLAEQAGTSVDANIWNLRYWMADYATDHNGISVSFEQAERDSVVSISGAVRQALQSDAPADEQISLLADIGWGVCQTVSSRAATMGENGADAAYCDLAALARVVTSYVEGQQCLPTILADQPRREKAMATLAASGARGKQICLTLMNQSLYMAEPVRSEIMEAGIDGLVAGMPARTQAEAIIGLMHDPDSGWSPALDIYIREHPASMNPEMYAIVLADLDLQAGLTVSFSLLLFDPCVSDGFGDWFMASPVVDTWCTTCKQTLTSWSASLEVLPPALLEVSLAQVETVAERCSCEAERWRMLTVRGAFATGRYFEAAQLMDRNPEGMREHDYVYAAAIRMRLTPEQIDQLDDPAQPAELLARGRKTYERIHLGFPPILEYLDLLMMQSDWHEATTRLVEVFNNFYDHDWAKYMGRGDIARTALEYLLKWQYYGFLTEAWNKLTPSARRHLEQLLMGRVSGAQGESRYAAMLANQAWNINLGLRDLPPVPEQVPEYAELAEGICREPSTEMLVWLWRAHARSEHEEERARQYLEQAVTHKASSDQDRCCQAGAILHLSDLPADRELGKLLLEAAVERGNFDFVQWASRQNPDWRNHLDSEAFLRASLCLPDTSQGYLAYQFLHTAVNLTSEQGVSVAVDQIRCCGYLAHMLCPQDNRKLSPHLREQLTFAAGNAHKQEAIRAVGTQLFPEEDWSTESAAVP